MSVRSDCRYAKSHEWAKLLPDGTVLVGISDYAQSSLGDITYVQLPKVGAALKAGDTFGVVESVKAASDVYAPLAGEVVEVNQVVVDDPASVNADPQGRAWFFKLRLDDLKAMDGLMDEAAYQKLVESSSA